MWGVYLANLQHTPCGTVKLHGCWGLLGVALSGSGWHIKAKKSRWSILCRPSTHTTWHTKAVQLLGVVGQSLTGFQARYQGCTAGWSSLCRPSGHSSELRQFLSLRVSEWGPTRPQGTYLKVCSRLGICVGSYVVPSGVVLLVGVGVFCAGLWFSPLGLSFFLKIINYLHNN